MAANDPSTKRPLLSRLFAESGLSTVLNSPRDTKLLILQRIVRFLAYGSSTLVLTLLLSALEIPESRIGLFMSMTLWGDVAISFLLTLVADTLGRRRVLVAGAALMAMSGAVFATASNYWVLVAASVFGVITPSGNEVGPFKAIEDSVLAQLTPKESRSDVFAWQTLGGTVGVAVGTITAGWVVQALQDSAGWSEVRSFRAVFVAYTVLGLAKLILTLCLSNDCEAEAVERKVDGAAKEREEMEMDAMEAEQLLDSGSDSASERDEEDRTPKKSSSKQNGNAPITAAPAAVEAAAQPSPTTAAPSKKKPFFPAISRESLSILWKLSILFAIDSAASGLVPPSWVIYFFKTQHNVSEGSLGTLFFSTNVVAAASHLVAAALARRIGLVKTMAFTHMPSAVSLALIPAPRAAWMAMMFLVFRHSTSSMDQAPKVAFLAAVLLPSERTAVMGYINVVKTLSQSVGPYITGLLASAGKFWVAFVLAGTMKIAYDLMMLGVFVKTKFRE